MTPNPHPITTPPQRAHCKMTELLGECIQAVLAFPKGDETAQYAQYLSLHSTEAGVSLVAQPPDGHTTATSPSPTKLAQDCGTTFHTLLNMPAHSANIARLLTDTRYTHIPFWTGILNAVNGGILKAASDATRTPEAARRVCFMFMCCVAGEKMLAARHTASSTPAKPSSGASAGAPLLKDEVALWRERVVCGGTSATPAARLALPLVEALYLPQHLNLRNLTTHGYLEDVDVRYCSLALVVLLLLAECMQAPAATPYTIPGAELVVAAVEPDLQGVLCDEVDRGVVARRTMLLLLQIEARLRALFCDVNEGLSKADAAARMDAYYITLDGYGQRSRHEVVLAPTTTTGTPNRLPDLLGGALYSLLLDLFMSAGGPNLRGVFVHGLCDLGVLFADGDAQEDELFWLRLLQMVHDDVVGMGDGAPRLVTQYPCPGVCHPTAILARGIAAAEAALEGLKTACGALSLDIVDSTVVVSRGGQTLCVADDAALCERVRSVTEDPFAALSELLQVVPQVTAGGLVELVVAPKGVNCHVDVARCVASAAGSMAGVVEEVAGVCAGGAARSNKRRALVLHMVASVPLVARLSAFALQYLHAAVRNHNVTSAFAAKLLQATSQLAGWTEAGCPGGAEKHADRIKQFASSRAVQTAAEHWQSLS